MDVVAVESIVVETVELFPPEEPEFKQANPMKQITEIKTPVILLKLFSSGTANTLRRT